MTRIQVVLGYDHLLFMEGLKNLLEAEEDVEVVGMAQDGREVIRLCEQYHPEIVILDVALAGLNGIQATLHLKKMDPAISVIGCSISATQQLILKMLRAGANGFLNKNADRTELIKAIKTALKGEVYLSPSLSGSIIHQMLSKLPMTEEKKLDPLTLREKEVLQLMAEGKNMKQISALLKISPKTVETHRKNIMDKLNIHDMANLVKYAIRNGLTSLNS